MQNFDDWLFADTRRLTHKLDDPNDQINRAIGLHRTQSDRTWESRKDGRISLWRELACEIVRILRIRNDDPRITLYSSASRRNSITSAVGNGLAFDLSGTLLSIIRTVLPDLLPLQIINFVCDDYVIVALPSRLHTDRDRRRCLSLFSISLIPLPLSRGISNLFTRLPGQISSADNLTWKLLSNPTSPPRAHRPPVPYRRFHPVQCHPPMVPVPMPELLGNMQKYAE